MALANPDLCPPKILDDAQSLHDVGYCDIVVFFLILILRRLTLIDVEPICHVDALEHFL